MGVKGGDFPVQTRAGNAHENGNSTIAAPGMADDDLAAVESYRLRARNGSCLGDRRGAIPREDFVTLCRDPWHVSRLSGDAADLVAAQSIAREWAMTSAIAPMRVAAAQRSEP
jgi:hypothetical protein